MHQWTELDLGGQELGIGWEELDIGSLKTFSKRFVFKSEVYCGLLKLIRVNQELREDPELDNDG